MADQEIKRLQREISETKANIAELERLIRQREKEQKDRSKQKVEECKKDIENLKRNKEELENKKSRLSKELELQGIIKGKEMKLKMLEQKVKENKKQFEGCKKEREDLMKKRNEFIEEIDKLKNEIQDLKEKIDEKSIQVSRLENEIQRNKKSHQKDMADMKKTYKKDIDEAKDCNSKKIQDMEKRHENEIKKFEEISKAYQWNEEEVIKLTEENKSLKKDLEGNERLVRFHNENSNMLYMAQICSDLQTNTYHYVMPKNYCPKGCWSHKIKDIYKDIDDEEMDDGERKEAKKRLKELKKSEYWKNLQKLAEPMGKLKGQRNNVAHPQDLDKEEAKRIAQELHRQGKLKGKTRIENITQIINLWSVSKSLVNDENCNLIQ